MKGQTIDTPVRWIHEDSTGKLVSETIPKMSDSIMQKVKVFYIG